MVLSGSRVILLKEEILHQLIGSLSHCLQGSIHPRWCRIFSINPTKVERIMAFYFYIIYYIHGAIELAVAGSFPG